VTEAVDWFPWSPVPEVEHAFDRYRRLARDAAVGRAAVALRQIISPEALDDRALRLLAEEATDAALRIPPEQADLFGTQGRLVARLFGALDQLRWHIERRHLADLTDQAIQRANEGSHQ
jgi:hypothetical protein